MRILFCPEYFFPHMGGAELWTWQVSKELRRGENEVTILTYRQPGHSEDETIEGVRVLRVGPFTLGGQQPYLIRGIQQAIGIFVNALRLPYDVVIAGQTSPVFPAYFVARLRRKPVVAVFHNVYGLEFSQRERGLAKGTFRGLLEQLAIKLHYDATITVSASTRTKLLAYGVPPERIGLVGTGIDPLEISAARSMKFAMPTAIYVGRLARLKRVGDLIKSFGEVAKNLPSAQLLIVGDGALRDELAQMVEKEGLRGRVHFMGFLSHEGALKMMSSATVLVQPSSMEGLSLVVLEALALGTPVIATATASVRDLLVNGVNGYIVRLGDVKELTKRMEELLADPSTAKQVGERGMMRVRDSFTWQKVANRLEALVQTTLSDGKRNQA